MTISVVSTGVWSDKFPPKTYSGEPSLWFALFYVLILQHFSAWVNMQEKSTSLIAAVEGGNKLAWEKIFLLHFLTAAIFYWPLCGRWAEKILSFVLCIYLYLIYIIGRSRSGSSSCSSLIAFSATWKPINWYFQLLFFSQFLIHFHQSCHCFLWAVPLRWMLRGSIHQLAISGFSNPSLKDFSLYSGWQ